MLFLSWDIPLKIGKYFLSLDFTVLELGEDPLIPFILGRSSMVTARTTIDVIKVGFPSPKVKIMVVII